MFIMLKYHNVLVFQFAGFEEKGVTITEWVEKSDHMSHKCTKGHATFFQIFYFISMFAFHINFLIVYFIKLPLFLLVNKI